MEPPTWPLDARFYEATEAGATEVPRDAVKNAMAHHTAGTSDRTTFAETMMIIRSPIALNDWPGRTQPKSGHTHRRQTALTHPESPVIAERGPMQWGISDRKRGSPTYDVPARGHVHPSGWPTHGDETGSVFGRRRPGARPTTSDFANPDPRRSFHARPRSATPKIAIRLASEWPIVSFQVRLVTHIWHRSVGSVTHSWTILDVVRGDATSGCGQGLWAAVQPWARSVQAPALTGKPFPEARALRKTHVHGARDHPRADTPTERISRTTGRTRPRSSPRPDDSAQGVRGKLAGERPRNEFACLLDAVQGDEGAEPRAALFAQ